MNFKYNAFQYNTKWSYEYTYSNIKYETNFKLNTENMKQKAVDSLNKVLDTLIEQVNAYKTLYLMQSSLPNGIKRDEDYFIDLIPDEVIKMENKINDHFRITGNKFFSFDKQSFYMIFELSEEWVRYKIIEKFKEAYDEYQIRFMAC